MDPTSQNPAPGADESSNEAKVEAAEKLLSQFVIDEPWVICARVYVERVKQGLPVEPTAWESVRVGLGFVAPSPSRDAVLKVVDIFQPQGEFELNKLSFEVKRENLSVPFAECLEIFAAVAKKFVHFSNMRMGENEIKGDFQKSIAAEHLKEFIGELRALRLKIELSQTIDADDSLDSLRLLIDRRIRQSGYMIGFMELSESTDQTARAKAFLQADLADELYARTLRFGGLPEAFRNQLIGPQCSIPEMKLATLVEIDAERSARNLNTAFLDFLEIMRDAGDSISGTGIPVKTDDGRSGTASLLPDELKSIVGVRNIALSGLVSSVSSSSFGRTVHGQFLKELMTTLVEAGDFFIQTINARSRDEHIAGNKEIDIRTKRIGELVNDSRCPRYVSAYLMSCCKNTAPITPIR